MNSILPKKHFKLANFFIEKESQEYGACRFEINGLLVIGRNAKITSKKIGQFVTVWKRDGKGTTQPFDILDKFDFFVINIQSDDFFGQFVFPKSILIKEGIISSNSKNGKRGFWLYPPWDKPKNKQAEKTQKWQLKYFLSIDDNETIDIKRAKLLYFGKK